MCVLTSEAGAILHLGFKCLSSMRLSRIVLGSDATVSVLEMHNMAGVCVCLLPCCHVSPLHHAQSTHLEVCLNKAFVSMSVIFIPAMRFLES